MLNISAQRLSGTQRALVLLIYNAAIAGTPVTTQQWYNFNLFTAWRNPYYLVYRDYASEVIPSLLIDLLFSANFEGNSDNLVTSVPNTDNNILYSPTYGKIGEGAWLNGVNSDIQLLPINPGSVYSLNLWINPSNIGPLQQLIIGTTAASTGLLLTTPSYQLDMFTGLSHIWSVALMPGVYSMITLTSNGVSTFAYVNATLVNTFAGLVFSPAYQSVGVWGGGNRLSAYIDMLSIWKRQITQSEITALYNGSTGIQYPF